MFRSTLLSPAVPVANQVAPHQFAYPRVRQISPRAHTVLASSLRAQPAYAPAAKAL